MIHPTAVVEDGVVLGDGTRVWHHAHLRTGATVGRDCIVGGRSYLAPGVRVGDRCKINSAAYLCAGVTLGTGVMISANVTFTNDRFPRACSNDLSVLRPPEVDEHTLPTLVDDGATVGAGAVVGCGLVVGRFAVVGMGAVVTRSVPAHAVVVGNPARVTRLACRCGRPLGDRVPDELPDGAISCPGCEADYEVRGGAIVELEPPSRGAR